MSRYGKLAAGPDRRVTAADMACWRDLVRLAMEASESPQGVHAGLARTVDAARHACAPGVVSRDNAFTRRMQALSRLTTPGAQAWRAASTVRASPA
ncbi:MAG: hypothetical protein EON88_33710, partial [Brevundimonas sp.]